MRSILVLFRAKAFCLAFAESDEQATTEPFRASKIFRNPVAFLKENVIYVTVRYKNANGMEFTHVASENIIDVKQRHASQAEPQPRPQPIDGTLVQM